MIEFTEKDDSIIFTVRIVPRASKSEIVGEFGSALKIRISAPPVDGAANKELIKLLTKTFAVAKSEVKIISGETARTKQVKIFGLGAENFLKTISR